MKILHAKRVDERKVTFDKVIQVGKDYEWRMKSMLVRSAVVKSGLQVKSDTQASRDGPMVNEINAAGRN